MNHQPVATPSVHPTTGYSHATRVGNLLFIAGQIARDRDGRTVGEGDIAAQAEQVLANIKAIVEDAGCSMDDIVKLTTYTVDLKYRPAIAEARRRYFKEYFPPNTFLVISSLAEPVYLLEIEAVAALPWA